MRIISGTARGRRIEAPSGSNTRPTLDRVRENLFNMIQGYTENSVVLDLFSGSGALSLESISRGARFATMVDHDKKACDVQLSNLKTLGFQDHAEVIRCDWKNALKMLKERGMQYDLIFLDPPYSFLNLQDVFTELIPVMKEDTLILLEHEAKASPEVPGCFELIRERNWGFCGFRFYRLEKQGGV